MPFRKIEDGTDDTEGNMPLRKVVEDGVEEDDAEGNKKNFRVEDGVEEDDTEGNRIKLIR